MRSRDSQRARVYKAEAVLAQFDTSNHRTTEQYERRLREITGSQWMAKHYPNCTTVSVTFVQQRHGAAAGSHGISTGTSGFALSERIMLHELAHVIDARNLRRSKAQWHDWRYCQIFLELVSRFMGTIPAAALKASFKANKVRYKRPAKRKALSPEHRAELAARLAAHRVTRPKLTLMERIDKAVAKRGWLTMTSRHGWVRIHKLRNPEGKLQVEHLAGSHRAPYSLNWFDTDEAGLPSVLAELGVAV